MLAIQPQAFALAHQTKTNQHHAKPARSLCNAETQTTRKHRSKKLPIELARANKQEKHRYKTTTKRKGKQRNEQHLNRPKT